MDIIKSYKDLCEEIEIWKWRVEAYRAEIDALQKLAKVYGPQDVKGIDYSQPRVDNTGQVGFEEFLIRLHKLESHIFLHEKTIEAMVKSRVKMEEHLERLEGLDRKVVYMRDIKGMLLVEIAGELGYSYDYIREISSRNKRPTTTPQTDGK